MSLLKEMNYEDINFEVFSSQQFATVVFDCQEDSDTSSITIIKDGKIRQFDGINKYNPSKRRHSSCVYVHEEGNKDKVIKICTIQHKGVTLLEIHDVTQEELSYLFQ